MRRTVCAASAMAVALAALSGVADAAAVPAPAPTNAARGDTAAWAGYPPPVGSLRMVSYLPSGAPAGQQIGQDLSADGRYLAFTSQDPRMTPDGNYEFQVYLRDLVTGDLTLVTRGADGEPADSGSSGVSMSADGSRIVFESLATNLVDGTPEAACVTLPNFCMQIYLYDTATHAISLVSSAPDGQPGDDPSRSPKISADGTHVAFDSRASNLVPGAPRLPRSQQVYVAELDGEIRIVTPGAGGVPADGNSSDASISADGRIVAFTSKATNLGAGENDSDEDVFVLDLVAGRLAQVSTSSTDLQGNSRQSELSDDGRHVVFVSDLSGLTDEPVGGFDFNVYVQHLATGERERISRPVDGGLVLPDRARSEAPTISSDGILIAYQSEATNLVADQSDSRDFDAFLYDTRTATNVMLSQTRSGASGGGDSTNALLSGDGNYAAFTSYADNLSNRDRDDTLDIFVTRLS